MYLTIFYNTATATYGYIGQPELAHKNTRVYNHVFVVARVIMNTIIPYNMYGGDSGRRRAHRVTVSRELSANVVDRSAHAVQKIYEPTCV